MALYYSIRFWRRNAWRVYWEFFWYIIKYYLNAEREINKKQITVMVTVDIIIGEQLIMEVLYTSFERSKIIPVGDI